MFIQIKRLFWENRIRKWSPRTFSRFSGDRLPCTAGRPIGITKSGRDRRCCWTRWSSTRANRPPWSCRTRDRWPRSSSNSRPCRPTRRNRVTRDAKRRPLSCPSTSTGGPTSPTASAPNNTTTFRWSKYPYSVKYWFFFFFEYLFIFRDGRYNFTLQRA